MSDEPVIGPQLSWSLEGDPSPARVRRAVAEALASWDALDWLDEAQRAAEDLVNRAEKPDTLILMLADDRSALHLEVRGGPAITLRRR